MADQDGSDGEIIRERRGEAGLVTLNRPQALNALTLGMVRGLAAALDAWEADPGVTRVVVVGAGAKAFSAGGDIRRIYELGRAGERAEALTFWREEYRLNARIKRYPKPYLALIDGIVMGGGVGVSIHGSHRVAGEGYVFAMPEVGIGFFPDVGATFVLPRLPGEIGTYLALTGERVRAGDAVALGLATHAVPSAAMPGLVERLAAGESVEASLAGAAPGGPTPLLDQRALIDRAFAAPSVGAILERLDAEAERSPFAAKTAATMRTKSPTSLCIALEQMRRGRALRFEEALALEFRIVTRVAEGPDFYEGVRALIVDKDQAPRWNPARLEEVDPAVIARYFEPLPHELFEAVEAHG